MAEASERRPLVVCTSTNAEAESLATDLASILGADEVDMFPAWETLPFERVSPGVETMGRRMRTRHRLESPDRCPAVVVAPTRALVQRLLPGPAPWPVVVGQGDQIDAVRLVEDLVGLGYRREPMVEHRGEIAVRGSIVDVFPSTTDAPVRIDLWGDEVDRLTEFSVGNQRATVPIAEIELYPCRELRPDHETRVRASDLVASDPWGREQWDRLADGQMFDGMESWLPWLLDDDLVLLDLVPSGGMIVLVEPNRIRDRATEILGEEVDLASSLARTWGVDGSGMPRLHIEFDRLLSRAVAPTWTMLGVASSPDTPVVVASGWDPVVGDITPRADQLRTLLGDGYRVIVTADVAAGVDRITRLLVEHEVELTAAVSDSDLDGPGGHVVAVPLEHGAIFPGAKLAVLSEHDLTGRRRTHRRARVRPTGTSLLRGSGGRSIRGAPSARRGSFRRHGHAGHRRQRAGLPAARVPGR